MTVKSEPQSVELIKREVEPVVQRATAIVIRDPQQYEQAAAFLKAIKAAQKTVVDFFGPMKTKAHAAWKAITSQETETLAPLAEAERHVKNKMLDFAQEQERIRQAEERRLQAEADERARKERERLEREAAKLKSEERREAKLEQAAAIQAPVVTVAATTPDVAGQSIRKTWKARIVDPKAAATALLAFPDWQAYLTLQQGAVDKFAVRTKGQVAIPGVEFYEAATLASGRV